MKQHRVVIVGAGPGGAAAAIALAQRGIDDVLLLDRDPFPRDKTCGSGLSPNALKVIDELGLGGEVRERAYPIDSVRIVTPGGREMLLSSNAAAVVLLRRYFDHLLVQRAQKLGVTLETGFRADQLLQDGAGRVVGVKGFDGGERRGDFVFFADGAQSIFALDKRPKRSISTLMGWWENVDVAPRQLDMVFDKSVAPLYGWMFPETDRRVNIGICIDGQDGDGAKTKKPLKAIFEQFLATHYGAALSKATQVGKLKGHPIVYSNWVRDCTRPGALYLGEAARVTHNATGEGIFQAMQSGIYAAEAVRRVVKGEETEAESWSGYLWQHRKRFTAGALGGLLLRAVVDSTLLDRVAGAYNNPTVRKWVVTLLGSALAGSAVGEAAPAADEKKRAA